MVIFHSYVSLPEGTPPKKDANNSKVTQILNLLKCFKLKSDQFTRVLPASTFSGVGFSDQLQRRRFGEKWVFRSLIAVYWLVKNGIPSSLIMIHDIQCIYVMSTPDE